MGRARLGLAADEIGVSYVGTIGMAHGLATVIEAARLLKETQPRIKFFIIGDGAELTSLRTLAASLNLPNIVFTGLLPRSDIPFIMAGTDVALVTLKASETFKNVLPSKMFEAMAARKPIVLAVDGEARQTLEQAGGGLHVAPGDSAALADTVVRLACDRELRVKLGNAGAEYVAREFTRNVWANRYLAILERICPSDATPLSSMDGTDDSCTALETSTNRLTL
jgi:glycosyltransferase involved in cell wall biosynthesis